MTDASIDLPPSATIAKKSEGGKKWGGIKAALRINADANDNASFHMMSLCKSNLDVRLSAIDTTSLSERQKEIYKSVEALLSTPTDLLEWNDIYNTKRKA
jgi:hypothetical protein